MLRQSGRRSRERGLDVLDARRPGIRIAMSAAPGEVFRRFARGASEWSSSPLATLLVVALVATWGFSGPRFHFSVAWQLVMSTTSSVVTFVMIFIIAHSQKRDIDALNLKLDVLIAANGDLSNKAVGIETASVRDVDEARQEVEALAPRHTRRSG